MSQGGPVSPLEHCKKGYHDIDIDIELINHGSFARFSCSGLDWFIEKREEQNTRRVADTMRSIPRC